jgi:hypothetical protein
MLSWRKPAGAGLMMTLICVAADPVKPGELATLALQDTAKVELLIGNAKAGIVRRERAGVTFRVPERTVEGCYVPVHVLVDGKMLVDSLPLSVSRSGNCTAATYQPSSSWLSKRTAIAARVHGTEVSLENSGSASTVDVVGAFFDGDASTLAPGVLLQFPPPGLCSSGHRTYVRGTATVDILLPMMFNDITGLELDAGESLTLDDGKNVMRIPRAIGRSGLFWRTVASTKDDLHPVRVDGGLNLRAPGGSDIQPFVASLPVPAAFEWVNRPSSPVLDLRRDVPLSWKTATPGVVLIAAVAVDPAEAQFSYCLCIAPRQATRFDLPRRVLASMVGSLGNIQESGGALYLIHLPESTGRFESTQFPTSAILSLQTLSAKVVLRRPR